ncbi:MAG: hypothetical protein ACK4PR_02470 [Gammaproteobacteria bacterium]
MRNEKTDIEQGNDSEEGQPLNPHGSSNDTSSAISMKQLAGGDSQTQEWFEMKKVDFGDGHRSKSYEQCCTDELKLRTGQILVAGGAIACIIAMIVILYVLSQMGANASKHQHHQHGHGKLPTPTPKI